MTLSIQNIPLVTNLSMFQIRPPGPGSVILNYVVSADTDLSEISGSLLFYPRFTKKFQKKVQCFMNFNDLPPSIVSDNLFFQWPPKMARHDPDP